MLKNKISKTTFSINWLRILTILICKKGLAYKLKPTSLNLLLFIKPKYILFLL